MFSMRYCIKYQRLTGIAVMKLLICSFVYNNIHKNTMISLQSSTRHIKRFKMAPQPMKIRMRGWRTEWQ